MTLFDAILVLIGATLQVWLAFLLLRTRVYKSFWFFFMYTLFAVAATLLKTAVYRNYRIYFVTYWSSELVFVVFGMLAMFETFPIVFKSFTWTRHFRLVVWLSVGLMIVISVLQAIYVPPIQAGPLVATIYSLGIGARYIQGGVLLVFVLLAWFYRMQPRRYASGIILGFWFVALGDLIPAMLRSEFGTRFKFLFTYGPPVIYVIAVVIWLFTFLKPEPPDPYEQIKSPLSPEQAIERIKRLTQIIKGSR